MLNRLFCRRATIVVGFVLVLSSPAAAQVEAEGTGATPSPCLVESGSNLDGVRIEVAGDVCALTLEQVAEGVAFEYEVVIEAPVDGVVTQPQDAGRCGRPGESGLITDGSISGGEQFYGLTDAGRCLPPDELPQTLTPGTYASTFEWSGRNWSGPSDTMNPMGEPFPPGEYVLRIDTAGYRVTEGGNEPFEAWATLRLELLPGSR